ncbi:MAG: hypothetical protein RBU37_08340, partial [Myxococcota bacterium]|nr:hypothetical protein [Myxococcota bacterium]
MLGNMARSSTGNYVLKFISGKYQGGEFSLDANQEIIIGRSKKTLQRRTGSSNKRKIQQNSNS